MERITISGSIKQLLPNTISWNVENYPLNCKSEKFTLCGNKYEFFFLRQPVHTDVSFLYLRQSKALSLQFDVRVELKYEKESKIFALKKFSVAGISSEVIHMRRFGVREIICTFFNIQELENSFGELVLGNKSTEKEEIKDTESLCETQALEYNTEIINPAKSRGKKSTKDEQIKYTKPLCETQAKESNTDTIDPVKIRGNKSTEDEQIEDTKNFSKTQAIDSNTEIIDPVKIRRLLALSENLKDVFLDEEDSDVTINVGDQKYPAHKIIIRARSPVFNAMLKHDMKGKREDVVNIHDCDPHIFKDFLQYLYAGKLNISNKNVVELYEMSNKYEVIELRSDCTDFIFNNLNVDMICDVISLATKHFERDLLSHATKFLMENAKDILTTVNWQTFVKENPVVANEFFIKIFNVLKN